MGLDKVVDNARLVRNMLDASQVSYDSILWFYVLNAFDYVNVPSVVKAKTSDPQLLAVRDQIAKLLSSSPTLKLLVVGHTDNVGEFGANLDLSKRRADAVITALAGQYKVDRKRLTPVGVSFASPVAPNTSDDGKAKNRRVELVPNN